jgi:tetratricopeptide (TPR) repeat protein
MIVKQFEGKGHGLALLLGLLLVGQVPGQEIAWQSDYSKALKEAADRGRLLFVNVGTENCYWCKQLETRTFKDAELLKLITDRCVPLKIDAAKNTYLVQALRVQSYPTLVLAGPDGAILHYKEGFVEAAPLREQLVKSLAAAISPAWMVRDVEAAGKAVASADHAKALALLRNVVEDGRSRPAQVKARKMIQDLEKQAEDQAARARDLASKGKTSEAIASIQQLSKSYPGTLADREGKQLLLKLTSKAEARASDRKRQAEELLRQAQEDYKSRQLLCCLDRCEILSSQYADLPEGPAAEKLANEIKLNPEWTKQACDQLGERLCVLYLALADSWLKKGQPQQAIFYLERIIKMFPGSRQAEAAQVHLTRLRGAPPESEAKRSG